jgi:glucosyl-3-phosphoglycerate synthase
LTLEDPDKGLLKMGTDIAKCLFRNLASRGHTLTHEFFISLKACYLQIAQDFIARYEYDSAINGLKYDRHREVGQAEAFLRCIESAAQQFLKTPLEVPYIANWNRVASAVPSIFNMLLEAVEADSKL